LHLAGRLEASRRRRLLVLVAGSITVNLASLLGTSHLRIVAAQPRPSLHVYLHTEAKSAVLESALKERLPALDITVFGRFTDFEDALTARKPDAVLAILPLLLSQNIPVTLQGLRENNEREPYVLLSAGGSLDGSLSGKVIGVVDLLGRAGTQDFVGRLLKTPDLKFKRVTKIEDLLPLLQFSAAEGVLVPAVAVKGLTERSRLPLRVKNLDDAMVGLPAVGVLNGTTRAMVIGQLQALDAQTRRLLGIDRWRAP
jgi:hypothetical protein